MSNVSAEMAVKSARAHDVTDAARKPQPWSYYLALAWLAIVIFFVVFGEWLPWVDDPNARDSSAITQPPSWEHWFGTASFGQDVFSRVVVGGRISLFVGFMVTAIGIIVGGALGMLAGYLRGWVDSVVRLIINATLSVPALLLVIFIVTIRGQSLWSVIIAVSLLAIPSLARIVRASTLQVAERDFVKASEVLGVRRASILVREVLPNVMPTLVSFSFLTFGIILVVEGSLSFLGLSIEAPAITWGSIINEGRAKFRDTPYMVFIPGAVLFLTVLSLNFVGDHLLKRFDIKESGL
jgi:peptide/nickel transport system permease protein